MTDRWPPLFYRPSNRRPRVTYGDPNTQALARVRAYVDRTAAAADDDQVDRDDIGDPELTFGDLRALLAAAEAKAPQ